MTAEKEAANSLLHTMEEYRSSLHRHLHITHITTVGMHEIE